VKTLGQNSFHFLYLVWQSLIVKHVHFPVLFSALCACTAQDEGVLAGQAAAQFSGGAQVSDLRVGTTTSGALAVSRVSLPLTNSDGLPAKRAALAYCAGQGGRLDPAAFGQFTAGSWYFAGGCV
jgi:hypothetical protein